MGMGDMGLDFEDLVLTLDFDGHVKGSRWSGISGCQSFVWYWFFFMHRILTA